MDDKEYFNERLKDVTNEVRSIKSEVLAIVNSAILSIKESISDKLDPIKENQVNYKNTLDLHFNRLLDADKERTGMCKEIENIKLIQNDHKHKFEKIESTVNGLDRRQSTDEKTVQAVERVKEKVTQRKDVRVSAAIAITGIIVGALLGFFL